MRKLLKKVFKKELRIPVQDPIAILIARLCDPTDIIYDEKFAKSMQEEYTKGKK